MKLAHANRRAVLSLIPSAALPRAHGAAILDRAMSSLSGIRRLIERVLTCRSSGCWPPLGGGGPAANQFIVVPVVPLKKVSTAMTRR